MGEMVAVGREEGDNPRSSSLGLVGGRGRKGGRKRRRWRREK